MAAAAIRLNRPDSGAGYYRVSQSDKIADVLFRSHPISKGSGSMEGQQWLDWVSRFTHIATAITLVGGSVFTAFVLLPAAQPLDQSARDSLATGIASRWKRFVHLGVLLFLVSGAYNYYRAIDAHRGDSLYHALLGTKMLLALAVFFLAEALVGRSAKLEGFRRHRTNWLRVLVLLATIIVAISGFVKIRGVPTTLPSTTIAE